MLFTPDAVRDIETQYGIRRLASEEEVHMAGSGAVSRAAERAPLEDIPFVRGEERLGFEVAANAVRVARVELQAGDYTWA